MSDPNDKKPTSKRVRAHPQLPGAIKNEEWLGHPQRFENQPGARDGLNAKSPLLSKTTPSGLREWLFYIMLRNQHKVRKMKKQ